MSHLWQVLNCVQPGFGQIISRGILLEHCAIPQHAETSGPLGFHPQGPTVVARRRQGLDAPTQVVCGTPIPGRC